MLDSESAVRHSSLAWTIMRPVSFMSNTLQWIDQLQAGDTVRAPFAHVWSAVVDPTTSLPQPPRRSPPTPTTAAPSR
jgi:hypothetical protein